jgi:hypothetical protein
VSLSEVASIREVMGSNLEPGETAQFNELTEGLVALAHELLARIGSFSPFAGGVRRDGEIVSFATDHEWEATAEEQMEALVGQLDIGPYEIGAVLLDVRVTPPGHQEKTDAILMIAETRSGFVLYSYLPYQIKNGCPEYGEAFHTDGDATIFLGRTKTEAGPFKVGTVTPIRK